MTKETKVVVAGRVVLRITPRPKRGPRIYPPVALLYAGPAGGLLLRSEARWRNVNGLLISAPSFRAVLIVRRWSLADRSV